MSPSIAAAAAATALSPSPASSTTDATTIISLPLPLTASTASTAAAAAAAVSSSKNHLDDSPSISRRRKDLFGDCALVEIIHLHDCLRGALRALEQDVEVLHQTLGRGTNKDDDDDAAVTTQLVNDLERRVNGRFKVIWSVFRAHSSAEDEFIWPALQLKTQGTGKGSPKYRPDGHKRGHSHGQHQHGQQQQQHGQQQQQHSQQQQQQQHGHSHHHLPPATPTATATTTTTADTSRTAPTPTPTPGSLQPSGGDVTSSASAVVEDDTGVVDQESYEEDHADEERMFSDMDDLLTRLREGLVQRQQQQQQQQDSEQLTATNDEANGNGLSASANSTTNSSLHLVDVTMKAIHESTRSLSQHLMAHLEKEEKECMPLVVKHLSKSEIHYLVGQIMGQRSSNMISEIMTMAVQNLHQADRLEMVKYMKQAMAGTFFDKWLSMSGWMEDVQTEGPTTTTTTPTTSQEGMDDRKRDAMDSASTNASAGDASQGNGNSSSTPISKRTKLGMPPTLPHLSVVSSLSAAATATTTTAASASAGTTNSTTSQAVLTMDAILNKYPAAADITSQAELEKLIRAIATNPTLTPQQKNTTIQGLRDSVWKSNQRLKGQSSSELALALATPIALAYTSTDIGSAAVLTCIPTRRATPPSLYFKMNSAGKLEIPWDSNKPTPIISEDGTIPLFSASELAPNYHDGATGAVLGCPHYARACKLRHPVSGRMYTCRLCCEQEREMPSKDQDKPLDRYAVQEVMCMKCNSLQPADDRCINHNCESAGKPFAKYFCKICHLYDDRPRPIFHCPYCNTCRMGLGLGIDFRHCMRCNACVSLADHEHRCIPQKLQGSCPICHELLFQSTEPLRGLKCGHVMHLSCFSKYRRGQSYKCPLCMKSMEDMTDYFTLLDAAVRMQPMPMTYLSTMSNVYCQDCEKTGQCRYHFVGQRCPDCGSYNTRELGRVQATTTDVPVVATTSR